MDWEGPPPRDPTLLRLGRRLRREDLPLDRCDEATVNGLLEEGSRELAWAVNVWDYQPPLYRVCHFKEMINNNVVVFRTKGPNKNEVYKCKSWVWQDCWPLIGYKVDTGRGWLKPFMQGTWGLRIRRPVMHYLGDFVSSTLALNSPTPNLYSDLRERNVVMYALVKRSAKSKSTSLVEVEPAPKPVKVRRSPTERRYRWQCVQFFTLINTVDAGYHFRIGLRDKVKVVQHKYNHYRLRLIRGIPFCLVENVNMWRMTLMFYAVRLDVPIERWIPNPATFHFGETMPIKRWNPFRFLGVEMCVRIAQMLDCCNEYGVLLDEHHAAITAAWPH